MKNISFKKIGLIIKNNYVINRSIPLILFIVALIFGCIVGALPVSDVESRYEYRITVDYQAYESYKNSMTYTYGDLIGWNSIFSIIYFVAAFGLAFLSVLALNSYMRDKSGNDFYHSLSVTRGEIFLANYITAFINSAVTIIASQLGGLLLMDFIADYKPMTLLEMLGAQLPIIATILLFLALFLALAMIATVGAGTVFASIINYICLNFYIPATILAVAVSGGQLFDSSLMEYLDHYPFAYAYSSPFLRYIFGVGYEMEFTALTYILLAVATLVFIAIGIWLYSVKKNENGSKPLPFRRTVRPLQYLLAFDAILLGATFFEAITNSLIWCVIGGLLALFFTFIIFNAFADKSFNGVFKRPRHMLFILIITLVLGAVFVADCFGIYKKPTPDYEHIEEAYINASFEYDDRSEWVSFEFVEEIDEHNKHYAVKLDERAQKLLTEFYLLVEDSGNSYRREEGTSYLSISMGIKCEDDFSRYHVYSYISDKHENWDRIFEIITELQENYTVADANVYYHEKTEVIEVDDEEMAETIIGGADGPTAIIVTE